jgi:hypothetical protein
MFLHLLSELLEMLKAKLLESQQLKSKHYTQQKKKKNNHNNKTESNNQKIIYLSKNDGMVW